MITWNTPSGNLGTFKELDYNEIPLSVTDSDNEPVSFSHLSGTLPPGMYITADGAIKGVPTITGTSTNNSATYVFSVRANNPLGRIADRTFSLVITNQSVLTISPRELRLGAFDNGSLISYQFQAISDNPDAKLSWSIVNGNPPLDIKTGKPMTLSSSGLFSGYIARLTDTTTGTAGYDVEAGDEFPYDFSAKSKDRVYSFVIQVTDGYAYDTIPVSISVVSKGNFTADNDITLINNNSLTVDSDNRYVPIITTDPSVIPVLQEGSKFSFKFDAIDPEDSVVHWSANAGLPNGISLSSVTGWLSGTVPQQVEEQKIYSFTVNAYKRDNPSYVSNGLVVNITTVRDSSNYITWSSPAQLGTMVNGSVSEFKLSAISNLGKEVVYEKLDLPSSRLPQGLKLLDTGEIVGRATFQYFAVDGDSSKVYVPDTSQLTVGMTVEGPGVASGSKIKEIININTIVVKPAIYAVEGTEITFRDLLVNNEIVTRTTSLTASTSIDKGKTTFDSSYKFTVKASTVDGSTTTTKEFTIKLDNYNRAPYENIYLKALPTLDQRRTFQSIVENTDIFPDELIYRPMDPWFGKSRDIRMLFLPGMTTSDLSVFANAIEKNHYNKKINFGQVKTARAVDENFNTKYEVVYLDVEDNKQVNGVSAALSQEPYLSHYYLYGNNSYHTLYPNSFSNMTYRLSSGVGYSNRGALPDWMTSPQEDGRVLGLVRGVVLAYTIPGASKLIAYRLANNEINFNNIEFVADRYQIDALLSNNYNTSTNRFYQNKEVTFDSLASVTDVDLVTAIASQGNNPAASIELTSAPHIGVGWDVEGSNMVSSSYIPKGTTVTSVNGTTVYLSKEVNVITNDQILFRGTASATYAVSVPFDTINNKFLDQVPAIDGVKNYQDGETILFVRQEQYPGYTGINDGWNLVTDLFIGNEGDFDDLAFDNYSVVPGYAEKLSDPNIPNQRAGIWRINIATDGLITLTLQREIVLNQVVKIVSGTSHASTFLKYDPVIPSGLTVPTYTPQSALQTNSTERTKFDGSSTRFYDHRDNYADPEVGDKYIKWSLLNVFR
jgi:hypothetical protein